VTRTPISSLADHEARWRPADRRGGVCNYTFRGLTCSRRGAHYCRPRADRAAAFFPSLLVHTKGAHVREAFKLRPWQEHEIIRPLFGEVIWSAEYGRYVRRYRIAYIIVGRKNGKSELAAGILLLLLVGDDEEAAEVYSAAKDTKQAGKVFGPALRMVQLSPALTQRLRHIKNARRIVDEKTASYYEVLTSDAEGELGHNPHGFNLDEVLSQPDGSMWEAMTTAAGARLQELMFATSTETDDASSFGAKLIDEAERVQEDPSRAPHVFSFVRKLPSTQEGLDRLHRLYPGHPDLPVSLDPFDEANWKWPNPALDDFLSRDALRRAALDARNDPAKENGFCQFRLNQRVQQTWRWMPMHLWEGCSGDVWATPEWGRPAITGRTAWFGFDLAAKFDLTAWSLLIPTEDRVHLLWRFWLPEDALLSLDKQNDGAFTRWSRDGWLTVTEGNVVDYDQIYADIEADARDFELRAGDGDQWSMAPVIQEIGKRTGVEDVLAYNNTYDKMTPGMTELMALVRTGRLAHHGNPVAQFCFDAVEVRKAPYNPDLIRPDKPERDRSGKRIDAVPAAAMACSAWKRASVVKTEDRSKVSHVAYGFN
jgi:phage terminase large subunit-like protein